MPSHEWRRAVRLGLLSGSAASLSSALAMAICGRLEGRSAAAALNGPSQWLWGIAEGHHRGPSLRHTAVGFAIHHLMSVAWATVYERAFRADRASASAARHLRNGALMATLAYLVDYGLTPRRLRPGFEYHLCGASMFAVYSAFGLGLGASGYLRARRTRENGTRSRRRPL